jgi:hypothetical protein
VRGAGLRALFPRAPASGSSSGSAGGGAAGDASDPLAALDASLVAELGGSRAAADALLSRVEREI